MVYRKSLWGMLLLKQDAGFTLGYSIKLPISKIGVVLLILLANLLVVPINHVQAHNRGNPLLRNYTPQEYNGHIQAWGITQTHLGHIMFGTGAGLIYYDGTRFANVENSGSMTTRLISTPDGTIYYASRDRFGSVEPSESGGYKAVPISWTDDPDFERPLGEVLALHAFDGDIWFSTINGLFRYSDESLIKVHTTDSIDHTFYKAFIVQDNIVVVSTTSGLYQINSEGLLHKIPGTGSILDNNGATIPEFIIPFDSTRYLLGTAGNGLFFYQIADDTEYSAGQIYPVNSEINEQLKQTVLVDAYRLIDGRFAIATHGDGVFVVDERLNLVQLIDHRAGLARQSINQIFEDRQGNLWLGLNGGLSLVEIYHPVTVYNESNGLDGIPIDILEVDETVYVASSLGLYKMNGGEFQPIDGMQAPTWGLNQYTDSQSGRNRLLVGNQFGLWLSDGNTHEQLQTGFITIGLQSAHIPGRIYYGTPGGLGVLQKNTSTALYESTGTPIVFNNAVRQILEDEQGGVWVALQSDGLRYLPPDLSEGNLRAYRFDEQGRNLGNATLAFQDGYLYLTNNIDLYRFDFDNDRFEPWVYAGLAEDEFTGTMKFLHEGESLFIGSSQGRRFITEYRYTSSTDTEAHDGVFRSISESVTLMIREMIGDIWFAQTSGLYRYDRDHTFSASLFNDVQIRRIEILGDSILIINPLFTPESRLNFSNNRIRFSVSAPWFDANNFMEYRYRLEGLDAQWSDWSSMPFIEYTALREGTYTFVVEARNREGIISQASIYPIHIQPPWFRNRTTRGLILILLLGFIFIVSRSYSEYNNRKLQAFNRKLEEEVDRRSKEILRQNEMLQQLNQEKNDFMNIAAHDLRNPLSAIQGVVSLMQDGDELTEEEDFSEYLKILKISSDQMYELIENYLSVHKIEQGEVKANLEEVCLQELTKQSIERFKQTAYKKNIRFEVASQLETNLPVYADKSLTAQVLDNLISNAVKYTPLGSMVTIQFEREGKFSSVLIIDEGPGVQPQKQAELFKKFSKIGSKPTGGEVSTGLGLSIVKKLAYMMRGDVAYVSKPPSGAAFRFSLPVYVNPERIDARGANVDVTIHPSV